MPVHYCLGLADPKFATCAHPWDFRPLTRELQNVVKGETFEQLARLPSFAWTEPEALSSHLIAHLRFSGHQQARKFRDSLAGSSLRASDYGFGSDPFIAALECWSPVGPGGGIFGNRDNADSLTGVAALREATGKGVNVIIVDRGLNRVAVRDLIARMTAMRGLPDDHPVPELPGWTRFEWKVEPDGKRLRQCIAPGTTGSDHADMIARNVLAIAPEATIWDAPLLPLADEEDAPPSLSSTAQLFHLIKQAFVAGRIRSWDADPRSDVREPCIVVNAWGVLDPESDPELLGYADDPNHFLVNDMKRLDAAGLDVVFAAGNCGEPCPDRRCGLHDTGPGRSIFGLNGHPDVLTVGAVRVDGIPVALSAQGPGRLAVMESRSTDAGDDYERAYRKPDLCAPSHFRESDDASEFNTGTSAACGFAAGVLAALRSVSAGRSLPPATMRDVLRKTALHPAGGPSWDPRLGFGVINAAMALERLGAEAARREPTGQYGPSSSP